MTSNTQNTKMTISQKRQLQIIASDIINNRAPGMTDEEYFAQVGKVTAMLAGTIPYEVLVREFHPVKPAETTDKTYTAYFYASAGDMRSVKLCLQTCFELLHLPQAKEVPGETGYKRFRVVGVTKESAQQVYAENKELFTKLTFNDEDRQSSGRKAETTLPTTPAQNAEALAESAKEVLESLPEELTVDTVDHTLSDTLFDDEETEEAVPEEEEHLEVPEQVELPSDSEDEEEAE